MVDDLALAGERVEGEFLAVDELLDLPPGERQPLAEVALAVEQADADEARAFASRAGARLVTVSGPSEIPAALSAALQ